MNFVCTFNSSLLEPGYKNYLLILICSAFSIGFSETKTK
jgi:hypothetical protein